MFVLYETNKAVQNSDSPYMGVVLAVSLFIILVVALLAIIEGRKR